MSGRVVVPKLIEWTEEPWGWSNATANGIQYDATPTNVAGDATWRAVGHKVFNTWPFGYPGGKGNVPWRMLQLATTIRFASPDNITALLNTKLQGRNHEPNVVNQESWTDISDTLSEVVNATWRDISLSGKIPVSQGFNAIPFELQIVYQANTASVVQAKMKNSGYVKFQYVIS